MYSFQKVRWEAGKVFLIADYSRHIVSSVYTSQLIDVSFKTISSETHPYIGCLQGKIDVLFYSFD